MIAYQEQMSKQQLSNQLFVGIKKHLLIAQTTSNSKAVRLSSLANIAEVLEYVCDNLNESLPPDEFAIFSKFFTKLLVKVATAKVLIHQSPITFNDEIGFISTVLSLEG